jgi:hypothetical protein
VKSLAPRAIVIGATPEDNAWVTDLERSLRRAMAPVEVHSGGRADRAIAWAAKRFEQFVYLPQTAYVKDCSPIDQAFEEEMSVSFALEPHPFAYHLGKYVARHVRTFSDRELRSKDWPRLYARVAPFAQLGELGPIARKVEVRHDTECRRAENEWLCLFLPPDAEPTQPRRRLLSLVPGVN